MMKMTQEKRKSRTYFDQVPVQSVKKFAHPDVIEHALDTPLLDAPRNLIFERPRRAPIKDWARLPDGAHIVQFYESDSDLIDMISGFVGTSLLKAGSAIIIATRPHRVGVAAALRAQGVDVAAARRLGRYTALDATVTLRQILRDGRPDAELFEQIVGGALTRAEAAAGETHPCVSAFGEMVSLLCEEGRRDAAIQLEQLWNALGEHHLFSLCCGYPTSTFAADHDRSPFLKICAQHSHVLPAQQAG